LEFAATQGNRGGNLAVSRRKVCQRGKITKVPANREPTMNDHLKRHLLNEHAISNNSHSE
jgi:hypothetical protein